MTHPRYDGQSTATLALGVLLGRRRGGYWLARGTRQRTDPDIMRVHAPGELRAFFPPIDGANKSVPPLAALVTSYRPADWWPLLGPVSAGDRLRRQAARVPPSAAGWGRRWTAVAEPDGAGWGRSPSICSRSSPCSRRSPAAACLPGRVVGRGVVAARRSGRRYQRLLFPGSGHR